MWEIGMFITGKGKVNLQQLKLLSDDFRKIFVIDGILSTLHMVKYLEFNDSVILVKDVPYKVVEETNCPASLKSAGLSSYKKCYDLVRHLKKLGDSRQ